MNTANVQVVSLCFMDGADGIRYDGDVSLVKFDVFVGGKLILDIEDVFGTTTSNWPVSSAYIRRQTRNDLAGMMKIVIEPDEKPPAEQAFSMIATGFRGFWLGAQ